jgi:hypothetical protein
MRPLTLAAALVLAVGGGLAGTRYEVVQSVSDRLSIASTIGNANIDAPSAFEWPRMTQDAAVASCDLCAATHVSGTALSVEYGMLVTDTDLLTFSTNVPNRPSSPAEVPLPRLVWVLQWHPTCWEVVPQPSERCATYELVDDATGWVLDAGQAFKPQ